jgi:murein DD-endopeptidase MepM/ murein hydrolase activator NlpD
MEFTFQRDEPMDDSTMLKTPKIVIGILLLLSVLYVSVYPLPVSAQGDYALPFKVGPINVSSAPGAGTYHSLGPSAEAIDFDLPSGTLLYPTKPGVVVEAEHGWNDGYGNLVQVMHHDGTMSIYGHMHTIFVKVDQPVGRSTVLGESGNSGNVSPPPSSACPTCGDLLHFEIRNSSQSEGVNVQYLVDWNDGCPGCSSRVKGVAVGFPRQQFLLDTFLYNSRQKRAVSTIVLEIGRSYLISIEGTFSYWPPITWGEWVEDNPEHICWGFADQEPLIPSPEGRTGPVGSDPEYQYAIPIYPGGCKEGPIDSVDPQSSSGVKLSIDGGAVFEKFASTNDTFNSQHTYQYLIEGNGQSLIIAIGDSSYGDNYGQLGVSIELFE